MINLDLSIEKLAHVGPRMLPRLKRLGIATIGDLVRHFPARYEDFSNIVPIGEISEAGQIVSVQGTVRKIEARRIFRRGRRPMTIINAVVEDDSGGIRATWFNQPYLETTFKDGTLVSLSGKVALDKRGLYLSSPSYERINQSEKVSDTFSARVSDTLRHTGRLVPVYSETEGVTSKYLRFLIKPIIEAIEYLPDPLPKEVLARHNLPDYTSALKAIHFPKKIEDAQPARGRFAFEELLLLQLRTLRDRGEMKMLQAPQIHFDKDLIADFVKKLPFTLTNDQRVAAFEILKDLDQPHPMNRLLNGDVGSGKTVVALIAAYQTMQAGYQAVFMAPTEILARQHYTTITSLLLNSKIQTPRPPCFATRSGQANDKQISNSKFQVPNVGLLTGNEARQWPRLETTAAQGGLSPTGQADSDCEKISKKLLVKKIANGEIDIVIGTHAVIQKSVSFAKLGLVIIDEQHRFGIAQRKALLRGQSQTQETQNNAETVQIERIIFDRARSSEKVCDSLRSESASIPHLLSMTATPIPRTLALTVYGDLDVSLLKEKPKGRQKIITRVVPSEKRGEAYMFIEKQIAQGRQVFVICPRIDPPSLQQNAGATDGQAHQKKISQARLVWAEVRAVTEEFEKLSKTVFPYRRVAMLHGRLKAKEKEEIMRDFKEKKNDLIVSTSVVEVGVDVPNAAIMMIESAERFGLAQLHQFRGRVGRGTDQSYCFLFTSDGGVAGRRLRAMENTTDGFELAEMDLKIRGPGEFAGAQQSGIPDLAMASLTDIEKIKQARAEAQLLLANDPTLKLHPLLADRLAMLQRIVHFE